MKKIAIALALSVAATSAFAQSAVPAVGADVTNLAPGGSANAVAGQTVVIAGVGTAAWIAIGGVLLLVLVSSGGSNSST